MLQVFYILDSQFSNRNDAGTAMESFIKAFVAYFVIVDPVGNSVIFNALTRGKDDSYARRMASRAVSLSTVLVLLFGFWGVALLGVLGIEMESFRIAGGLLIFYAAFGMITRSDSSSDQGQKGVFEDISVGRRRQPRSAHNSHTDHICTDLSQLPFFQDPHPPGGPDGQ
jgi:hypothetical protein